MTTTQLHTLYLWQMIEEVEERFTEDEITDILQTVDTILPHVTAKIEKPKKIKRTKS